MTQRTFDYPILDVIQARWSPRAFSAEPVQTEQLHQLLEALRYAPSSSNEQPWRVIVATSNPTKAKLQAALVEANREWAQHAPVLIALCAQTITASGKPNRYAQFDVGAAWAFLALEATHLNLCVHAMGGFDPQAVHASFKLDPELQVVAVIALGHQGDPQQLSEKLQVREHPNSRKSRDEICLLMG
jgi:nitroreductase